MAEQKDPAFRSALPRSRFEYPAFKIWLEKSLLASGWDEVTYDMRKTIPECCIQAAVVAFGDGAKSEEVLWVKGPRTGILMVDDCQGLFRELDREAPDANEDWGFDPT